MIRYLVLAAALVICAASPSTARSQAVASDLAERERLVLELFIPAFVDAFRPPLEASWDHFPADEVYPDELGVAKAAHERSVDEAVERASARAAAVVLKHVPLDQLRGDDIAAPEWQAALAELLAMKEESARDGLELAVSVIEAGCRVRNTPSARCADMLKLAADYREGRLTVDDIQTE